MADENENGIVCDIRVEADLSRVRQALREAAKEAGLGIVDQTKLVTAGSELARNVLKYALPDGGSMSISIVTAGDKQGVRAVFRDGGPGIPELDKAMLDGYSTGGSLGIGLPGTRRLVDGFSIESSKAGTIVKITKWRR